MALHHLTAFKYMLPEYYYRLLYPDILYQFIIENSYFQTVNASY